MFCVIIDINIIFKKYEKVLIKVSTHNNLNILNCLYFILYFSQNLIQKINNLYFEEEPYLYSLDIVSLYTNINQSHAIDTITDFMFRYLDNFHIDIIDFHMLLKIMFNSNVFFLMKTSLNKYAVYL